MTDPTKRQPDAGPAQPDRRDLLKAYKDVVHEEQEKLAHRGLVEMEPPKSRKAFWITVLVLLSVSLGSIGLHPEWFVQKERVESSDLRDASLRLLIYREILRVENFKKARGRLPVTLAEAGGGDTDIAYAVRGYNYFLSGSSGTLELSYDSRTSSAKFVGNSYERVRRRNS